MKFVCLEPCHVQTMTITKEDYFLPKMQWSIIGGERHQRLSTYVGDQLKGMVVHCRSSMIASRGCFQTRMGGNRRRDVVHPRQCPC